MGGQGYHPMTAPKPKPKPDPEPEPDPPEPGPDDEPDETFDQRLTDQRLTAIKAEIDELKERLTEMDERMRAPPIPIGRRP